MECKRIYVSLLFVVLFLVSSPCSAQTGYITDVIDGDTIRVSTEGTVRLIGVDTPETYRTKKLYRDAERTGEDIDAIRERGKEATLFVKRFAGKRVRLEFDVDKYDRYSRTLAYVFITEAPEEVFLNAELIRQGHADLMSIPPNIKYADLFREIKAEKDRIGFVDKTKKVFISEVLDGDTLKLRSGEKIGLIGIDAPETYICYKNAEAAKEAGVDDYVIQARGEQSASFLKELVEGKEARLDYGIQKCIDKFGRSMAYVSLMFSDAFVELPQDLPFSLTERTGEVFLNAEIIRQGYAKPVVVNCPTHIYRIHTKYDKLFKELYDEARELKKGLWE